MAWYLLAVFGSIVLIYSLVKFSSKRKAAKRIKKLNKAGKNLEAPFYSQNYQIRYAHVKRNHQKHPHYIYRVRESKKGKMYYSISLTTHPKRDDLDKNKIIFLKKNSDLEDKNPEYAVKEKYYGMKECYDHTDFHAKKNNPRKLDDCDIIALNAFANRKCKRNKLNKKNKK